MSFMTRRSIRTVTAGSRGSSLRACRAGIEAMEGRELMTSIPTFASVDITGQAMRNYQVAASNFAPMENTNVNGVMTAANTGKDNFRVYMTAGQIDDITLNEQSAMQMTGSFLGRSITKSLTLANLQSSLQVTDPSGHQVAATSQSGSGPEVTFQAPTTGWYSINESTATTYDGSLPIPFIGNLSMHGTLTQASYTASVRPIGLDPVGDSGLDPNHKAADAAKLGFADGALSAYLGGRAATNPTGGVGSTGKALNFVGPTGRGFTIDGTWTESRAKNGDTTYTGTNLQLEVADPLHPGKILSVPLPLSNVGLSVDLAPDAASDAQGLFGVVKATNFAVAGMPLGGSGGIVATLAGAMGAAGTTLSQAGFGASMPGLTWGVALGATASAATNDMPANAAVPYIYFAAATGGASVNFGSISVAVGKGVSFSALIDPADPSFAIDVTGIPIVHDVAVGVSANELIPYVPNTSGIGGSPLFGDLFLRGALDVAALSGDVAPIDLSGDITLALDPDRLGLSKIGSTIIPDVKAMTAKQAVANANQLLNDMKHISLGVNGTVSLSLSAGSQVGFSMPAATASLEWNGMQDMLSFAGSTADPLKGTCLSSLTQDDKVFAHGQVNCNDGSFDVKAGVSIGYGGMAFAGATVDIAKAATGPVKLHLNAQYTLDVAVSLSQNVGIWPFSSTLTAGASVHGSGNFDVTLDSDGNMAMNIANNFTASAWLGKLSISTTVTPTNLSYSGNFLTPINNQLAGLTGSSKQKALAEAALVIAKYLG